MDQYPLKWITESLAVGYAPHCEDDLRFIRDAGIRAVVNLCAECYDLSDAERAFGFDVYHLPIADEGIPGLDELATLIAWMDRHIGNGNRVLVHCRYGIGRTGTVVLTYLLHAGHEFIQARQMMKQTPSWPANRDQEDLVDRYSRTLGRDPVAGKFPDRPSQSISQFFERWQRRMKWHD